MSRESNFVLLFYQVLVVSLKLDATEARVKLKASASIRGASRNLLSSGKRIKPDDSDSKVTKRDGTFIIKDYNDVRSNKDYEKIQAEYKYALRSKDWATDSSSEENESRDVHQETNKTSDSVIGDSDHGSDMFDMKLNSTPYLNKWKTSSNYEEYNSRALNRNVMEYETEELNNTDYDGPYYFTSPEYDKSETEYGTTPRTTNCTEAVNLDKCNSEGVNQNETETEMFKAQTSNSAMNFISTQENDGNGGK